MKINLCDFFFFGLNPEQIFKPREAEQLSDKSQKVVDNILKLFPNFDAFSLPPPTVDPEVLQNLTENWSKERMNPSFIKGVEDFRQMLRTKLSTKPSFGGQGVVTGEGWSKYSLCEHSYFKTSFVPCFLKGWGHAI